MLRKISFQIRLIRRKCNPNTPLLDLALQNIYMNIIMLIFVFGFQLLESTYAQNIEGHALLQMGHSPLPLTCSKGLTHQAWVFLRVVLGTPPTPYWIFILYLVLCKFE